MGGWVKDRRVRRWRRRRKKNVNQLRKVVINGPNTHPGSEREGEREGGRKGERERERGRGGGWVKDRSRRRRRTIRRW